ncbi:hypothetical protein IVB30_19325 [Bradyrhizobium sp. 200]|uniref:hypothetical protein n=1 Tax=Bradyrhizobium sp. 200 TaxID=2782665 RepID=UPI0020000A87|nr:hypothetical protein [Bradyrhizobium sp. 200]UPJ53271.1 hypothetical protein IVB30_19325 [Bradyrhizobium sp. 200]
MRFGILIAIALVALTNVAMAQSKHPQDVQKINAALPTAKITPAQRAQVIKLRNEGEAFHNAGQHGKAEVVLEQAKAILRVR